MTQYTTNDTEQHFNELRKIPYNIDLFCYHGKTDESISSIERLELVIQDSLYKSESLFYLIFMISNTIVTGNTSVDFEQLLHSLKGVAEIGWAINHGTHTSLEQLVWVAENKKPPRKSNAEKKKVFLYALLFAARLVVENHLKPELAVEQANLSGYEIQPSDLRLFLDLLDTIQEDKENA